MSKSKKKAKKKIKVLGIVLGLVLAIVCRELPEKYQVGCNAVARIAATGGCGV